MYGVALPGSEDSEEDNEVRFFNIQNNFCIHDLRE